MLDAETAGSEHRPVCKAASLRATLMSDIKPAGLTWESFAEKRIRESIERGEFSRLPGLGAPLPGLNDLADENWWVKRKLREEGLSVVPPILEARRAVEQTRQAIRGMTSEPLVRRRLEALNEQIRQAHYSIVAGPADGVQPLNIEAEIAAWRDQQRPTSES